MPTGALQEHRYEAKTGEAIEVARESGTNVRKKTAELFDNSYAEQLSKAGFLKDL